MRYNTPDPGLDYYGIYEAPPNGELSHYPDTAYGMMSWWDYGHWIEVIGHRKPNANPFQSGIGGRSQSLNEENRPGASTFFTAPSEEAATAVLEAIHPDPDKAAARYIVSDVEMATGKFYAMTAWTLRTTTYRSGPVRAPSMYLVRVTSTRWKQGSTSLTETVSNSTN